MRKQKRLADAGTRFDVAFERLRQKRQKLNSPQVASQAADKAVALVESRGAAATNQKVKHDA